MDDDEETGIYAEAVRRGNTLVSVAAGPAQTERAAEILNRSGAIDIDRHAAAWRESGYQQYDPNARPYSADEAARERQRLETKKGESSIPVVQEEMQVGKRAVSRGGGRIYSHMVSQPVTENVTLREEHVRVERRNVDRPLAPGEADQLRDQSIEVLETSEEPVVSKRARVREEIVVGKEATERTEQVRDNVRHTEVKVDRIGSESEARDYDRDAYEYGYRMASDPRYKGRKWSEVERDLSSSYARDYPGSAWDKMKDSVRRGWDKVTGRT